MRKQGQRSDPGISIGAASQARFFPVAELSTRKQKDAGERDPEGQTTSKMACYHGPLLMQAVSAVPLTATAERASASFLKGLSSAVA